MQTRTRSRSASDSPQGRADVVMQLHTETRVHPQGLMDTRPSMCAHRPQTCPNLASCAHRHKRDGDTPRNPWDAGHRLTKHTTSSCPSPVLPEGCSLSRADPRPPTPRSLGLTVATSVGAEAVETVTLSAGGAGRGSHCRLSSRSAWGCRRSMERLLASRCQTRRGSLAEPGDGVETAAPEEEGPRRLEEGATGKGGGQAPHWMSCGQNQGPGHTLRDEQQRQAPTHRRRDADEHRN